MAAFSTHMLSFCIIQLSSRTWTWCRRCVWSDGDAGKIPFDASELFALMIIAQFLHHKIVFFIIHFIIYFIIYFIII